jgi:Flp pilus assembly pilin Flp
MRGEIDMSKFISGFLKDKPSAAGFEYAMIAIGMVAGTIAALAAFAK